MNEPAYSYDDEYERYEIIHGEIYMMSSPKASHVRVNGNIHGIFRNYLKNKRCEPFNQFNVFFDEDNQFIPDEIIVCNPEIVEEDGIHGTPDLVVEILSKSTARKDRTEKFFAYEKYGVKEYWIIVPETKTVEVYLLKDGKLQSDGNTYTIYSEIEWKMLNDREKSELKSEIKVSLYDDFYVKVEEVFERIK